MCLSIMWKNFCNDLGNHLEFTLNNAVKQYMPTSKRHIRDMLVMRHLKAMEKSWEKLSQVIPACAFRMQLVCNLYVNYEYWISKKYLFFRTYMKYFKLNVNLLIYHHRTTLYTCFFRSTPKTLKTLYLTSV